MNMPVSFPLFRGDCYESLDRCQQFIEDMKTRPTRREQTALPGVIAINGVPIKVGDDTIGGIGLSGSPGVDEECVNAGIDKVKQYLK